MWLSAKIKTFEFVLNYKKLWQNTYYVGAMNSELLCLHGCRPLFKNQNVNNKSFQVRSKANTSTVWDNHSILWNLARVSNARSDVWKLVTFPLTVASSNLPTTKRSIPIQIMWIAKIRCFRVPLHSQYDFMLDSFTRLHRVHCKSWTW